MEWKSDLSGYKARVADIRFVRDDDYISSDLIVNASYFGRSEKWYLKLSILFELCLDDLQVLIDWAESVDTIDAEGLVLDMTKEAEPWIVVYGQTKERKYFKRTPYAFSSVPQAVRNAAEVVWAAVCCLPGKQDDYAGL